MDETYQYPPELFQLLVDTIPLLCRGKDDILLFFKGAGVGLAIMSDLLDRVQKDRKSINKYEITRTVLSRLNEQGDRTLRQRREILKRVSEFEDFSSCWADDQLKARGLVTQIGKIIGVKDSFTRMKLEREEERKKHLAKHEAEIQQVKKKKDSIEAVKRDFCSLFSESDPQKRGVQLEKVLNQLFSVYGILVRESFRRTGEKGEGVLEQIDGVVEFDGHTYFVEMKWLKEAVAVPEVSTHLVRIYHRDSSRGIFISATEFTSPALKICQDALQKTVIILVSLEELVMLLERDGDLIAFLKEKVNAAIVDKQPYKRITQ